MMIAIFFLGFGIGLFCGGLLILYTAYVLTSAHQDEVYKWSIRDYED